MRRCIQEEFGVAMFRLIARSVNGVLRHPPLAQSSKRGEWGKGAINKASLGLGGRCLEALSRNTGEHKTLLPPVP